MEELWLVRHRLFLEVLWRNGWPSCSNNIGFVVPLHLLKAREEEVGILMVLGGDMAVSQGKIVEGNTRICFALDNALESQSFGVHEVLETFFEFKIFLWFLRRTVLACISFIGFSGKTESFSILDSCVGFCFVVDLCQSFAIQLLRRKSIPPRCMLPWRSRNS